MRTPIDQNIVEIYVDMLGEKTLYRNWSGKAEMKSEYIGNNLYLVTVEVLDEFLSPCSWSYILKPKGCTIITQ